MIDSSPPSGTHGRSAPTASASQTAVIATADDIEHIDVDYLVASAEPAVVFSSLARLCVPAFSDLCTIDVVEHERAAYRISYPLSDNTATARSGHFADHNRDTRHRVSTRFDCAPSDNAAAYFGVVTYTWATHNVTAADAAHAQLLTDRAVAAITDERRAAAAQRSPGRAQAPSLALSTGRGAPREPEAGDEAVASARLDADAGWWARV